MWRIVEKEICLEDQTATSYGIGGKSVVIHDISTHKDEIENFVKLLNELDASEIHAYELVEDFLGR